MFAAAKAHRLPALRNIAQSALKRNLHLSAPLLITQVVETVQGNEIVIEGRRVESDRQKKLLKVDDPHGACPLCRLNVDVTYRDVLILRQFMRSDGTVIPKQISGLCAKQQRRVENSVIQAHWVGLFPDNKPDVPEVQHNAGFRKLNRYFDGDRTMRRFKMDDREASFYVVRRYHDY